MTDTITKLIALATTAADKAAQAKAAEEAQAKAATEKELAARAEAMIAAATAHVTEQLGPEVADELTFTYGHLPYDEWADATLAPGVVLRFFTTGLGQHLVVAHTCHACSREERYDVRDLDGLAQALAEVTGPQSA